MLDPHVDSLNERWKQGETNARRLFEELQQRGYRGCETTVRNFAARLRRNLPGMVHPPRKIAKGQALAPASSPRELRWLLARRTEDLEPEKLDDLARLLKHSQEATLFHQLLQTVLQMLRSRQADWLDAWMQAARDSDIKEMKSFAARIERDYDAGKAGLSLPWEGTGNTIQTHKRRLDGQAGFVLLPQKMLHQKGP